VYIDGATCEIDSQRLNSLLRLEIVEIVDCKAFGDNLNSREEFRSVLGILVHICICVFANQNEQAI
jgi:hypothetical protein